MQASWIICSHPSNAATMLRWLDSSATGSVSAVVSGAGLMPAPLTCDGEGEGGEDRDEGCGRGSKQMMHCSGSSMTPVWMMQSQI